MLYTVLSIPLLALLLAITAHVIRRMLSGERQARITFIRSFKKGKCAVIYLAAVPLFWIGLCFSGGGVLPSFFEAIPMAMSLVVLKFDIPVLSPVFEESLLFAVTTYFCFFLVTVNALLFSLSVFSQHLFSFRSALAFKHTGRDRLLILGNSEEGRCILRSSPDAFGMIVGRISPSDAAELYMEGIRFKDGSIKRAADELIKLAARSSSRATAVVALPDDDEALALSYRFRDALRSLLASVPEEERKDYAASLFSRLTFFVLGSPEYETLYERAAEDCYGCLRYVNKYKQIALDFIDRYPLSRFIPRERILPDTTLLPGSELAVVMVGFGKTGREILLSSVASNQFLTRDQDGRPVLLPVDYHIFDRAPTEKNKNLNHGFFRYRSEVAEKGKDEDYLPLPPEPCRLHFHHEGMESPELYDTLYRLARGGATAQVIIAFGTDLENIDLAEKLSEKKHEWGAENLHIFTKVRRQALHAPAFLDGDYTMFGDEGKTVLRLDLLRADRLTALAQVRDELYALEAADGVAHEEILRSCRYRWYATLSHFERASNLYAVLGLRQKLHLLGLDYKEGEGESASFDAFYPEERGATFSFTDDARGMLALLEHYRWNAFMLTRGFVPATKEEILTERGAGGRYTNGKSYRDRRHGCLTTDAGLLEFRRLVAARDGVDEEKADVIRYDYQLTDEAERLLLEAGYILTEKTE